MNLTDQLFRNHLYTVSFKLLLIMTILIFCDCIIHEVVHFHCLIEGHCVLWRTSHWLKIGTYIVKIKLCLKLIFWWCDALIYGFFSTFNVRNDIKFGLCQNVLLRLNCAEVIFSKIIRFQSFILFNT